VILVDTSNWVDHLRAALPGLTRLLHDGLVLAHPWVVGELALGHLTHRQEIIGLLNNLPQAAVATADELLALLDSHQLYGIGIGYVDAQLLAAAKLTEGAKVWTSDRRLGAAAERLGVSVDQTHLQPELDDDEEGRGDWFAFSPESAQSLPPERRGAAEQAMSDYRSREPLAEIHLRILGWEPGQSEVSFSGGPSGQVEDPEWHDRLFDRAIEDIRDARRIFGSG